MIAIKITFFSITLFYSLNLLAQSPIDTAEVLQINGIKQFISIKGTDRSKPLLLFLHGGPGNSVMHYAEKFTKKLQEHFVVVQWDQRQAGKTLELNKSPEPLSVTLFEEDTRTLIDSLLNRFDHPKLYLAGHSWGTYLGFYIAKNYPHLLYAYFAISPMVNQLESERTILQLMKATAIKTENNIAQRELGAIEIPFENGEQLYFHRKWVLNYMGSKSKITKGQVEQWSETWLPIFNAASKDNLFESAPRLECPVYFFIGRKDYQTNAEITEKYFQILRAPKKELFWFERSAHALPTTEPEKLQDVIISLK